MVVLGCAMLGLRGCRAAAHLLHILPQLRILRSVIGNMFYAPVLAAHL